MRFGCQWAVAMRTIGRLGEVVFCLLLLLRVTVCQKLPIRDELLSHIGFTHADIFYDTKLLPDGAEVTTYLYRAEPLRIFFLVEEDDTPVSIIVTPCGSQIEWTITLRDIPEEKSEEDTVDDPLQEQRFMSRRNKRTGKLLTSYKGTDVSSYTSSASPAGILVLELVAPLAATSVQVYATTTPYSDHPYPELPSDSTIDVLATTKESVTLRWKASPTISQYGQPVEYCVTASRKRAFKTKCGALSYIFGVEPPTAPPYSGFGFSWEKKAKKGGPTTMNPFPKPMDPPNVLYECIGDKTTYSFNNLRPGRQYYFDVFVVNVATNRSTAYKGLRARTRPNAKKITLKDGKVQTTFLKRNRGSMKFLYELRRSRDLTIVVQPCFGELDVQIYRRGNLVKNVTVKDMQTITLPRAQKGSYAIVVSTERRRSVSFRLLATTRISRSPFPLLPEDRSIKVFDNKKTCTSVTVAWLGTEKKQQYCLYIRPSSTSTRTFTEWNQCIAPNARKKSEKIMCTNKRFKDKNRAVMTERVRRLQPNSTYILDVYATKNGGQTLAYRGAVVSTRSKC